MDKPEEENDPLSSKLVDMFGGLNDEPTPDQISLPEEEFQLPEVQLGQRFKPFVIGYPEKNSSKNGQEGAILSLRVDQETTLALSCRYFPGHFPGFEMSALEFITPFKEGGNEITPDDYDPKKRVEKFVNFFRENPGITKIKGGILGWRVGDPERKLEDPSKLFKRLRLILICGNKQYEGDTSLVEVATYAVSSDFGDVHLMDGPHLAKISSTEVARKLGVSVDDESLNLRRLDRRSDVSVVVDKSDLPKIEIKFVLLGDREGLEKP